MAYEEDGRERKGGNASKQVLLMISYPIDAGIAATKETMQGSLVDLPVRYYSVATFDSWS